MQVKNTSSVIIVTIIVVAAAVTTGAVYSDIYPVLVMCQELC